MSDEHRWRRKCFVICLLALFIGLMGIVLPEQEDIAFEYIVNNTDLYNNGRLQDVTYTANDSAIQLFLIFHVVGTGASLVVDTNLSINGTVVEDRDYRTTAGAGIHEHFSMTAHIPKGANYSVTNSSNLETIEWREYPILTGRNGTLSINITQGGGTGSQNLSQVLNQGNNTNGQTINFTNSGKWLNVGYNSASGLLEVNTNNIFYYKQAGTFLGFTGSGFAYSAYDNKPMKFGESGSNYSHITHNATYGTTWYGNDTGGASGNLNITGFDQVNMYQELNMTNNSLVAARNVVGRMLIAVNMNSSNAPFFFPNDAKSGLGADYVGQYVSEGNSPTMILTGFGNDSTFEAPAFSGIRTRGNRSFPMPLLQDDIIFGQGGRGWFGIGEDIASTGPDFNLSASKIAVHMRAAQNWNVTAQGTKWYFYTTRNDTTTLALAVTLKEDGNVTIAGLAGTGDRVVCTHADGTLFAC